MTIIDATLATPYNIKPIEMGVDVVLHSATKYLGGWSTTSTPISMGLMLYGVASVASCVRTFFALAPSRWPSSTANGVWSATR